MMTNMFHKYLGTDGHLYVRDFLFKMGLEETRISDIVVPDFLFLRVLSLKTFCGVFSSVTLISERFIFELVCGVLRPGIYIEIFCL